MGREAGTGDFPHVMSLSIDDAQLEAIERVKQEHPRWSRARCARYILNIGIDNLDAQAVTAAARTGEPL